MECGCAQGDEEEEETDNLVNQVLDEIGINLDEQMVAAPGQKAQVLRMLPLQLCYLPCSTALGVLYRPKHPLMQCMQCCH